MEISARLHSSHLHTLFSDQSHLLFYGCSSSTQCKPIKAHHPHTKLAFSPLASCRAAPLHSASQPSPCSELDLLKELAILKAQVKLKKKELKAIAKDKKTARKQKKAKAKAKDESSSSSSSSSSSDSSSEASDGGKMTLGRLLKKDSSQTREEERVAVRGESHGLDHTDIQQDRNVGITQCMPLRSKSLGLSSSVKQAYLQSTRPSDRDETISGATRDEATSHGTLGAGHVRAIAGSIEVCMGGKCKKAGSQQLLSAFKSQIPASACVDATPCKCMGRCGTALNVKVRKEDTNPQHHSNVSVDDVGLILSHHFGLGPPLSGLPYLSSLPPSFSTAQM